MFQSLLQTLRVPDLRRKILFTLGILGVYRLAAHIPVPGLDRAAMETVFSSQGAAGQLTRMLNLLSGGALENFSVVAMGVYPYITASIIIQLLTPLVPALEELSKEGESGRNKITRFTYWLTIPLAIVQAVAQIQLLNTQAFTGATTAVIDFGVGAPLNTVTVLLALTAGTMFALWLGERITENGIGNGVSIIIFGGIVAQVPRNLFVLGRSSMLAVVFILALTLLTSWAIVIIQEGHRRVPVQYGKRVRGQKTYGGQSTYIPLRVNSAGMIPLIFAGSLLVFPAVIGGLLANTAPGPVRDSGIWLQETFQLGSNWVYFTTYFFLVLAFTYFYTDVVFRQQNLHETLQRNGGFVPGIRPGRRTEEFLTDIVHRITLGGALFLGIVAVIPFFAQFLTPGGLGPQQSMIIDSTGLLIVVGVVLDTIKQLEAQLLMRNYEGFIR